MKNKIEDLRNIMFEQLMKLQQCDSNELEQECNRSMHMIAIAENIISSANTENDFLKITGGNDTGFIAAQALLKN